LIDYFRHDSLYVVDTVTVTLTDGTGDVVTTGGELLAGGDELAGGELLLELLLTGDVDVLTPGGELVVITDDEGGFTVVVDVFTGGSDVVDTCAGVRVGEAPTVGVGCTVTFPAGVTTSSGGSGTAGGTTTVECECGFVISSAGTTVDHGFTDNAALLLAVGTNSPHPDTASISSSTGISSHRFITLVLSLFSVTPGQRE
jgi:hypothetical protein